MYNFKAEIVKNTLVDYPRLNLLREFLQYTESVPGDIAEVGVYKGGTAYLLAEYKPIAKWLYLFDTFTGMPEVDAQKDLHHTGDFNDTSLEAVKTLLEPFALELVVKQGVFPASAKGVFRADQKFSLVHLDVDIYTSVKECLEYFHDKMSKGGIIILDDYNEPNCPGAKLAADEFALNKNLTVQPTVQSQAIIQF